jgi:hypothetical protein
MNPSTILQFAGLFSALVGSLGLVVAFFIHREQVKTQIFLALSARYDELLHTSSTGVWLQPEPAALSERNPEFTTFALRFCTLVSLTYFLFLDHRIPKRMWDLMLRSAEQRMRSPLFIREWALLRSEFESFPEFVDLVTSVQCGTRN